MRLKLLGIVSAGLVLVAMAMSSTASFLFVYQIKAPKKIM
jgi:cyclic lactone autoinducer peptide